MILQDEKAITYPKMSRDSITKIFLENGAWKYNYYEKEWGEYIDKALGQDSTYA